ncbi:unnamed protein product [Amoebophrya sp. A25]|nr:unnamed protein product [Amoebophrya sp. A25]|eukprot:GSA25T00008478001.1
MPPKGKPKKSAKGQGGLFASVCFCCAPEQGNKVVSLTRRGLVTDPNDFRNQVQGVRRTYPEFIDAGRMRKVKFFFVDGKKRFYVDDVQEGRIYVTKDRAGNNAYFVDAEIEVLGHEHNMIFITWDEEGQKLFYVEDEDLGKVFIEEDTHGRPQYWIRDRHDSLMPIVFVKLDDPGKGAAADQGQHVHYYAFPVAVSDEVYFNSGFQRTGVFQIFWGTKSGDKRFYVADENVHVDNLRRVIFDEAYQQWRFYKPLDYQVEKNEPMTEDEEDPGELFPPEHYFGNEAGRDSFVGFENAVHGVTGASLAEAEQAGSVEQTGDAMRGEAG